MRKLIWIIFCLALVGCRTQQLSPLPIANVPSPDTTALPTFPAEALYVLGAQWEADSLLQQELSIADYIEQELMRLYPERAYKGYINKLCSTADRLLVSSTQRPTLFAPKQQEIRFAHGQSPSGTLYAILDSLSLDEELQVLELTPQEQADWQRLQALAHSNQPLTQEAFDTLNIEFFEEENILITLLLWRGPRMFYRILQSKARAEKLAYYYYGEANVRYLTDSKVVMTVFRLLVCGMVMFGALASLDLAWSLADLCMACMTACNLVAITLLSKYVVRLLKDYKAQKKQGIKDPVFKKESMPDIQSDLECW